MSLSDQDTTVVIKEKHPGNFLMQKKVERTPKQRLKEIFVEPQIPMLRSSLLAGVTRAKSVSQRDESDSWRFRKLLYRTVVLTVQCQCPAQEGPET